ncbi:MAG: arsenite methyltransferase [Balneolaceae bacterium]|nr:arsenite methyltransferase [Balneolaceae bacterium]
MIKLNDQKTTKKLVLEKYDSIGRAAQSRDSKGCCGSAEYEIFADDYTELHGYNSEADLGLGCGLPTEFAHIKPGDTVVDLGSGAGNDCFVARQLTGAEGRVIGLDFSPAMIARAKENALKLDYNNVEFLQGDIEQNPIRNDKADVVVSNCVMNLVPDKQKAFRETYRILKSGGHFSISDIVTEGELPEEIRKDAELYAGCVAGAIDRKEYLRIVENAGFKNLKVQKIKKIELPDNILLKTISQIELTAFRDSGAGIFSITLYAEK